MTSYKTVPTQYTDVGLFSYFDPYNKKFLDPPLKLYPIDVVPDVVYGFCINNHFRGSI